MTETGTPGVRETITGAQLAHAVTGYGAWKPPPDRRETVIRARVLMNAARTIRRPIALGLSDADWELAITEGELYSALMRVRTSAGGPPLNVTRLLLNAVRRDREERKSMPETFTADEMADALQRLDAGRRALLAEVIEDIRKHREPEYVPGGIYKAANGTFYRRRYAGDGWELFGSPTIILPETPIRPLVRVDK